MKIAERDVLCVRQCQYLRGKVNLPGDKSISHRAIILASIARGSSSVEGVQKGRDCLTTIRCMKRLGVKFREEGNSLTIQGVGMDGLREPEDVLNCENSGTTMRILSGLLAAQNFYSVLTGDSSLRKRPMGRIVQPLQKMGAGIWTREGNLPPLSIRGGSLQGINYLLPVASAQVKSCLLLAGLYARGKTRIREPFPSRDHTERMLEYMGVKIIKENLEIEISPAQQLEGKKFFIPRDISAAAFFIGGAVILEGSDITLPQVGVNPTRSGFLEILEEMGAKIKIENRKIRCKEEVVDLRIQGEGHLKGVRVSKDKIPQLIDEIPILTVVACFAKGKTLIQGAEELRVKETDRIRALTVELSKMGAKIEERKDGMLIWGRGKLEGAKVDSWGDHRIAMALAIAGICARGETWIKNAECIDVSFPEFQSKLKKVTIFD